MTTSLSVPDPATALETVPGGAEPGGRFPLLALTVVAVGAFFLASTPARNSDVWLRLATGRAFVEGTSEFGSDPFAYTTDGVRWVNTSWLSSVFLYLGYTKFGGGAVVAIKAVLFALTFALVFVAARGRGGWVVATALAGTAAVASGTATSLRPVVVSYLFFALTVWLLLKPRGRSPWPARWVLLPVFALWANLDEWFFVGPVAVALFALGRLLSRGWGEARPWVMFAVAGCAACLLNPYFFRVFRLPSELLLLGVPDPLTSELRLNEHLRLRALSARAYSPTFMHPSGALNPGAVAFWALGGVSLIGLAFPARIDRATRVLFWVAFVGLGIVHARAVPFAAVVAAVLGALPFADAVSRPGRRWVMWSAAALATVAFLGAAWAGWLQPQPYGARTWGVEPDPTLRGAAEEVARLRASGALPAEVRVFPLSPDAAHYLVWFSPRDRVFLDSRWGLYQDSAGDYETVRKWLTEPKDPPNGAPVLTKYGIGVILAHDSDFRASDTAVGRMASAPADWTLLGVSGRAALFGWNGAGRSFASARLDLDKMALDPARVRPAPSTSEPTGSLIPPRWYDDFVRPPAPLRLLDRDEADLYVTLFDGIIVGGRATSQRVGALSVGSFVGLGAACAGPVGLPLWAAVPAFPTEFGPKDQALAEYAFRLQTAIIRESAYGPIAPLLLSIRAGRRAVAEHPRDAGAHLALGEAYLRLARATRESDWGRELSELAELRRIQAVTAMTQAVRLDPDLLPAHFALYNVFVEARAPDLALRELKEVARLRRSDSGGLDEDLKNLTQRVDVLRAKLPSAQSTPVTGRARAAVELHLYAESLDLLLATDYAELGNSGLRMEVEGLLFAGRSAEVLDWVTAGHRDALGPAEYHWSRARAAAATGDYAEFDAQMRELGELVEVQGTREGLRPQIARGIGSALLLNGVIPAGPGNVLLAGMGHADSLTQARRLGGAIGQRARGEVLRGLLALERGDIRRAEDQFHRALRVWGSAQQTARGEGIDFPGRRVAQEALKLLSGSK